MTAWLREETPSFRYIELVCDLIVFRDRNISAAISGTDMCVASIGSRRNSAVVSGGPPSALAPRSAESRARTAWAWLARVPRPGRRLSSSSTSRMSVLAPAMSAIAMWASASSSLA